MAGQREGAGAVVEADARVRALAVELVGVDGGELARPQQPVDFRRVTLADERDAVDAALDQRTDLTRLLRLVIVARGDQELVAEFVEPSLQCPAARREYAAPERRHDM